MFPCFYALTCLYIMKAGGLGVIFLSVWRDITIHSILAFPWNLYMSHFMVDRLLLVQFGVAVNILRLSWNRWLGLNKTTVQDPTWVFIHKQTEGSCTFC